eukprot:g390.t1
MMNLLSSTSDWSVSSLWSSLPHPPSTTSFFQPSEHPSACPLSLTFPLLARDLQMNPTASDSACFSGVCKTSLQFEQHPNSTSSFCMNYGQNGYRYQYMTSERFYSFFSTLVVAIATVIIIHVHRYKILKGCFHNFRLCSCIYPEKRMSVSGAGVKALCHAI